MTEQEILARLAMLEEMLRLVASNAKPTDKRTSH
jgi:hypothetical protein